MRRPETSWGRRGAAAVAVPGLIALCLTAAVACRPGPGASDSTRPPATTEILWDEWGVPHVYAPDNEGLFFAYGWSQAQSHADLLLTLLGQARGRAAEYWGERYLASDRWVQTVRIPALAATWYDAQGRRYRRYLQEFCRGVNTWARHHPGSLSDESKAVLPIQPTDLLAHLLRTIHFTFVAPPSLPELAAHELAPPRGSNTWAIGANRTDSRNAILVANPHLPWSDRYTWHEAHLVAPGVDVSGATLVGMPFLAIAFNDHLGWSHTVNTHDGADLYELELRGDGYLFDGEVRDFEVEEVTLKVKEGNDSYRSERLTLRRSVHGPVVAQGEGRALALRVVGLDAPHMLRQYWEMATATDMKSFERAVRELQMPMFTVMYADSGGHILSLFGGETPVRSTGDWDFWSGVVPGTSSALLWTETHSYRDLPRVADPATGWLQNANDPPWSTTYPAALDPDEFPAYMAPRFLHFRGQRSIGMLRDEPSWSFDKVVAAKLSTRMELADRLLDDLDAAARAGGSDLAKRANEVLQQWDRTADAESQGGVLFVRVMEHLMRNGGEKVFARPWSASDPLTTPDGLVDMRLGLAALEAGAEAVLAKYGVLDVAWGEAYRLRWGARDLPANGGPGGLGIFRVVDYERDRDGLDRADGGDSYQAIVEFSSPLRARALLSYGNSSQAGSPHYGDQLELFANKQMREVWRKREEVEAHLEEREDLTQLAVGAVDS